VRVVSIFIVIALAFTYFGWGERGAADEKMQALCIKDGGVKIYETVTIPKREFDKWGMPRGKTWDGISYPSTLDPDYYFSNTTEFLKRGDTLRGEVEMSRYIQRIRRLSDGKLLAESISYGRSGGDHFINRILGGHPSGAGCPLPNKNLISIVFIQGV
jgi:hypothetical protein